VLVSDVVRSLEHVAQLAAGVALMTIGSECDGDDDDDDVVADVCTAEIATVLCVGEGWKDGVLEDVGGVVEDGAAELTTVDVDEDVE